MRKKKILIIEDEPDQIMVLKERLEANGYDSVSALDGNEGLMKILLEKPDLILLDIIMPGMDGYEVCNRIRQAPGTKNIPVIVISAAGAKELEKNCFAVGANECIRKPYEAADLLLKIKALLKK